MSAVAPALAPAHRGVLPRPALEAGGVALTSFTHLALATRPTLHIWFVVAAVAGWGGYAAWRAWQDPDQLRRWGFRRDNLWRSAVAPSLLAVVAAAAMVGWALWAGVTAPWTMVIPLVFYPIWGVVQQYLLQALVAGNLERAGLGRWWVVGITALLFGLVHYPYPVLMVATFGLGLAFTPMYLRWRNLWPLGVLHGWLGTLIYYLVLQRHPVLELFGG